MATQQTQLTRHESAGERRRWGRIAPGLLTYVSFADDEGGYAGNGGMVLDVSENGLALVAALAIADGARLSIAIPADANHAAIAVCGRVVWMAESKRRVGVELEELSPANRETMRRWMRAITGGEEFAEGAIAPGDALIGGMVSRPTAVAPAVSLPTLDSPTMNLTPVNLPAMNLAAVTPRGETVDGLLADGAAGAQIVDGVTKVAALPASERPQLGPMVGPQPGPQLGAKLRPELVRVLPGSGRPGIAPLSAPPAALALRAAELAAIAESVLAATKATEQVRKSGAHRTAALAGALSLLVVGSFWLGIVIGKDVLARRVGRRGAAVAAQASAPMTAQSEVPVEAAARVSEEPRGAAAAGPFGSSAEVSPTGVIYPPVTASRASAETPAALASDAPKPRPLEEAATSDTRESAGVLGGGAGAGTDGGAGQDVLVTPKVGDEALRVEFAEEVIAQSASLEIRARRFAEVPGVPPVRRHGAVKKERLRMGSMISRVTPQVPELATGAASGEEVVRVRATIAGDGHVAYVDPLGGPIALIPKVMNAVREWKYAGSALDGEPLETGVDLTITFRRRH